MNLRYIHVIPDDWGPYVDIYAAYDNLSKRLDYIDVISPRDILASWNDFAKIDNNVIVFWSLIDPGPRSQRNATVIQVYSEALDPDFTNLLPAHRDYWHAFTSHLKHLDGVAAHTPWMAEEIKRKIEAYNAEPEFYTNIPTFVLPVGWNPLATGIPRWKAAKHRPVVTWGSRVGRRELLLPFLLNRLGSALTDVSGAYGRGLTGVLDNAKSSLYIAHSDVYSFSTWRLWQGLATSAATIAEPGDAWPFQADSHYVQIDKMSLGNCEEVACKIAEISHSTDLLINTASTAFNELGELFTIERCVEDYLIPGSLKILESKNQ